MLFTLSRDQLEAAADIIMRVPGLFIIDYWWRHDRGGSFPNTMDGVLNAVISNFLLLQGFLLLLLPLSYVKSLYVHYLCGGFIICSHMLSKYYISTEGKDTFSADARGQNFYKKQLTMLTVHGFSAAAVSYLIDGPYKPFPPALGCYILPILARLADLPFDTMQILHNFSSAIMAFNIFMYTTYQVPSILDFAKMLYHDVVVVCDTYGFVALLTTLWGRLFVTNNFAVFWLVEFCSKLTSVVYQQNEASSAWSDEWYMIILAAVSSICVSPITLIATSIMISYVSYFVLSGTEAFLQGQLSIRHDNPMHSGWTEGLTLFLLAIQTGLAEMKMPVRIAAMTIVLFIVLSCLFQSMLEIVEPIVLALSASRRHNYARHIRALSLCLCLLVFPLYLTHILCQVFPIDFWMMVVLSSCALTSVQVVDLLIVHCLFLYDSYRSDTWEMLDDIVYYTRAITKVLEFLVAVFVVGRGLWDSTTSQFYWINGSILIVHFYFNVWQRLKNGWQSFLVRREAVKKSESLPSANDAQLRELDDICSICYTQMKTACVTPCLHYFHRTCLRKWLYVQNKCPLCHTAVTLPTTTT